ncbi:MAG: hypothetical protein JKY50_10225 [Oleispira sp.]|nr:hypothetical protein [Oleispira sp.]
MKKIILTSFLALVASTVVAEQENTNDSLSGLYVGGGLSYNNLDIGSIVSGASNKSATGFQLFAGLPLSNAIQGIKTYAELGLFQTQKFDFGPNSKDDVTGISGSVVLEKDLSEIDSRLYALARLGIEVGDDDGIFMGIGAGFRLTPKVEVRTEFVNKDLISSYQVNALIRF